jgi:hypothetical protein
MIVAESNDGIKREIIFNESLLLCQPSDKLSFKILKDNIGLNIIINFTFSDSGEKFAQDGSFNQDGSILDITLYKWNDPFFVENTEPVEFKTIMTGHKIWLKYRTSTDVNKKFRRFELTVWAEIK